MEFLDFKIQDYKVYLELDRYLTFIKGNSGIGKTLIFKYLRDVIKNPNMIFINEESNKKLPLKNVINEVKGKIIVIDNADLILDVDTKKRIIFDGNNQYIIFGKNNTGLWTTELNLAYLKRNDISKKFYLEYPFKNINLK